MQEKTEAPVRLIAGSGAETTARNQAARVDHMLGHWLGRAPTTNERFAALVPTVLDLLSDCTFDQVDAVLRCAYADLLRGVAAGPVVADRVAEVRHG